ncbi:MAG: peptidoglycan DD-metalloendopeptidase family protein [Flavobacteriales bacterium]|nr:peptidoglycan DD-metalloendopeptidase family protein [Flavobacteriales bacterium]
MMFRIPLISLALAALPWSYTASAQVDEIGYGGPEGLDIYEELSEEPTSSESDERIWDVNDSLTFIPGYDMYCHWNTNVLFDRMSAQRLDQDTLHLQLAHAECDHAMPCSGAMTSPYGMRRGRMHYGVDLDLTTGDPVVAAFSGMVRISKYNKSFGNVVVVRHYNGLETLYAHLSKRHVEPGTLIEAGDTLGLGGNTGRSYGSHLHFEVRFLDQPIDPTLLFDIENGTLKAKSFELHRATFNSLAAAKAASTASAGSRKYHIVRSGDTLSAISRRTGVRVRDLCRINGIRETSVLSIGQRIRYN